MSEIYDVYHGKELVRRDEDFSSDCQGHWSDSGLCGGCGKCIMAQASYSGHHFVQIGKVERLWRDYVFYPLLHAWQTIAVRFRKDREWF